VTLRRAIQLGFIGLLGSLFCVPAFASWTVNMPKGVTPISQNIYNLHMAIFWICVAIGVVVFSVLIYALINHRKSKGAVSSDFHEHPVLEFFWAVIPFLILVVMAVPATKVLIAMEDTADADLTIKVTGYQWKWKYEYLDQGISYFSVLSTPPAQTAKQKHWYTGATEKNAGYLHEVDNQLVLPTNKKIRFLVTANDVLHSWWVPAFGIKRDAIPGFIHESWARIETPGTYEGQCAELCGKDHGYMPIVVNAVSEEDFEKWVQEKTKAKQAAAAAEASNKVWSKDELMTSGKQTYEKVCAACHQVTGLGMPPTFPALKGSSVAVGKPVARHINLVLHGVKGTAMQAFGEQLSNDELAAVITYERNAWGNNTGDIVQPSDVKAERDGKKESK
jgi:cytochrome c oxidase subunit 2